MFIKLRIDHSIWYSGKPTYRKNLPIVFTLPRSVQYAPRKLQKVPYLSHTKRSEGRVHIPSSSRRFHESNIYTTPAYSCVGRESMRECTHSHKGAKSPAAWPELPPV